jgi:hypothetical protein
MKSKTVSCCLVVALLSNLCLCRFISIVGGLLWIARCTRLDILFAVHAVTRKTHAPNEKDLAMAKQIMRYLRGTSGLKLHQVKYNSSDSSIVLSG